MIEPMTLRAFSILGMLCREKTPSTVRALSHHFEISKPSVTRAIDGLEIQGYAQRKPDKSDRRSVLIVATPAGRTFFKETLEYLLRV